MHYIYTITNTQTGDVYLGQARWLTKRFSTHRCTLRRGKHHNRFLQRSYDKYGEQAFQYSKVEECETLERANEREVSLVEQYKAAGIRVYNIREGGKNDKMTEEHKRRISEALKGRPKSKEHRARMAEAAQGRKLSEDHKSKIAEKMADRVFTEEHRRKLSEAATGRKWTEEQKAKVRGKVMSPESRAKMSAAKQGKPWSEARTNVGH